MQLGFFFDQTRCIGCYTCQVACKDWHDVPSGPASLMKVTCIEEGKFPHLFLAYTINPCYHCADPPCVAVCPAQAISKRGEDGVVSVSREKCKEAARCGIIKSPEFQIEKEAPCKASCPAHVNVPAYVSLLAKGRYEDALNIIRESMPLPGVCGRICSRPCETQCLRKEVDEPVDILGLKRFAADSVAERKPLPLPKTKKEKVAIVGSGPAGLAAAYDLVREGYGVTIFEAFSTAGGMLALGIPEYRLPKDILEKEIEYIEGLGVEIKTGAALGKDFSLSELFDRGYGAIFIAIGAHRGMKLPVPGAELGNIMVGISLLKSLNLGKAVTMGDTVVVIGGGNVAVDCARSARRLGAKKVYMVCVESRENMPALASEVEQAEMEGVIILPSRTVTKIFGNHGKVKGLECLRLRRVEFDREGNLNFDAVEGSEHEISADTIIIAVGQTPEIDSVLEKDKIVCTKKGTIMVNPETMETNQPGVFAGGDAVSGPGTFIEAIAAGQKAAFFMDLYLKGRVLRRAYSLRATEREDIGTEIPVDIQRIERVRMPELSFAERALNFKEVALGFTADTAAKEAERCLNCAGALCRDVCPYGIPQFGYEENSKMQKCDLCVDRLDLGKEPICVAACPMRALDVGPLEELVKKYWDEKVIRGFINSPVIAPSIIFKPRER